MKVVQLRLRNFRNITDSVLFPDAGMNFLVGPNGQGKTSFLESLAYLATFRSFRDSKTPQVIQWGQPFGEIDCILSSGESNENSWKTEFKLVFQFTDSEQQKATKAAFINQKPYRSSTQYLSQRFGNVELGFHTVIFNPSDHDLVRGDPALRRAYLDQVISAQNVHYLRNLQKYHRVLLQRNALLKDFSLVNNSELLRGFTKQLCQFGAQITWARLNWIQKIQPEILKVLSQIAPLQPKVDLFYLSQWLGGEMGRKIEKKSNNSNGLHSVHFAGQGALPSLELLEQSFLLKSQVLEETEKRVGHSLVGPHRDDWSFQLGSQILKGHGSQGEVRSVLLALKLAEVELFYKTTGHYPLFLLDDFSSELDQKRREFLLKYLEDTHLQTFVTSTEMTVWGDVGKKFWVSQGKVEEGKENDDRTKIK